MSLQSQESELLIIDRHAKEIERSKQIEVAVKEAVAIVGNQGRYQVLLAIYFSVCFIFTAFLLVGPSYFFMSPIFECAGIRVTEDAACQRLSECSLVNDYTLTAKLNLYCDGKSTIRSVIQAMMGVGSILGVLFINMISDYKGRKFSYILALSSGIFSTITLIIGAYGNIIAFLMISQLAGGFTANALMNLSYVLSDKLMSKNWMRTSVLLTNAVWAAGEISFILFTGPLSWEDLTVLFMLIPAVGMILIATFFLVEDPVLLFTKMKFKECKESLHQIAMINKTDHRVFEMEQLIDYFEKEGLTVEESNQKKGGWKEKLSYLKLLRSKSILIAVICLGLFNFGGNCVYYILNYSIGETGNSYQVNIAMFGISEILGVIPMLYLASRIPRKLGLFGLIVIQLVLALLCLLGFSTIFQSIFIALIRFFSTSQYSLTINMQVETFPQHIQSTSIGIIEFISQMGKFVAPFLVVIAQNLEISPIFVVGLSMLVFGLIPLTPLKETLQAKKKEQKNEIMDSTREESQVGSIMGSSQLTE